MAGGRTPFQQYFVDPYRQMVDATLGGAARLPGRIREEVGGAVDWWTTPQADSREQPSELDQYLAQFLKEYPEQAPGFEAPQEAAPAPLTGFQQAEELRRKSALKEGGFQPNFTGPPSPTASPVDPLEEALANMKGSEFDALRPTDYTYVDGERVSDAERIRERFQTDDDLRRHMLTPEYQQRLAQASGLPQVQAFSRQAQAGATAGSAAMSGSQRAANRAELVTPEQAASQGYNPIDYGKIDYNDVEADAQRERQMGSQYQMELLRLQGNVAAAEAGVRPNEMKEMANMIIPLFVRNGMSETDAAMRFYSMLASLKTGYLDTGEQVQPEG